MLKLALIFSLIVLKLNFICSNTDNGYKKSWPLCYDKDEAKKPEYKDCLMIDKYCCYTSYSIVGYTFSACFYNNLTNNQRAEEWFNETMGAVIFAPSFNYTIRCYSPFISYGLILLIIYLGIIIL